MCFFSKNKNNLKKFYLFSFDIFLPFLAGLTFIIINWKLNISRCRGWCDSDPGGHLLSSFSLYNDFRITSILNTIYPPFVYIFTTLFYLFHGGTSRVIGEISISLFSIPLSLGIYYSCKKMGGRAIGFLGMFFLIFNYQVMALGQTYMLDLPLVTMVTLSMCFFLLSDLLKNRFYSILLGICLAIGFLTKYNFFYYSFIIPLTFFYLVYKCTKKIYIIILLCFILFILFFFLGSKFVIELVSIKEIEFTILVLFYGIIFLIYFFYTKLEKNKIFLYVVNDISYYPQLKNLLLVCIFSLIPSFPWYIHQYPRLWDYWSDMNQKADHFNIFKNFLSSTPDLWFGFSPMLFIGIILIPLIKNMRIEKIILLVGAVISFLIVSLTMTFQERFMVPIYPLIISLSIWWIGFKKWLSWIIVGFIIAVQVVININYSHLDPVQKLQLPIELRFPSITPGASEKDLVRCEIAQNFSYFIQFIKNYKTDQIVIIFSNYDSFLTFSEDRFVAGINFLLLYNLLADNEKNILAFMCEDKKWINIRTIYTQNFKMNKYEIKQGTLIIIPCVILQNHEDILNYVQPLFKGTASCIDFFPLLQDKGFYLYKFENSA